MLTKIGFDITNSSIKCDNCNLESNTKLLCIFYFIIVKVLLTHYYEKINTEGKVNHKPTCWVIIPNLIFIQSLMHFQIIDSLEHYVPKVSAYSEITRFGVGLNFVLID